MALSSTISGMQRLEARLGVSLLLAAACGDPNAGDGGSGSSGTDASTTMIDPTVIETSVDTSSSTDPSTTATTAMTTTPVPECGNGVREDPEQCDDGNQIA